MRPSTATIEASITEATNSAANISPACASSRPQRASKPGIRGPSMVLAIPVKTNAPKMRFRSVRLVELVRDLPRLLFAGLHVQMNVSFRANGGADRPEVQPRNRAVGGLAHTGAGLAILHVEIVIGGA